jgi:hypothetical protein
MPCRQPERDLLRPARKRTDRSPRHSRYRTAARTGNPIAMIPLVGLSDQMCPRQDLHRRALPRFDHSDPMRVPSARPSKPRFSTATPGPAVSSRHTSQPSGWWPTTPLGSKSAMRFGDVLETRAGAYQVLNPRGGAPEDRPPRVGPSLLPATRTQRNPVRPPDSAMYPRQASSLASRLSNSVRSCEMSTTGQYATFGITFIKSITGHV